MLLSTSPAAATVAADPELVANLRNLSIDDLANIEITSVSKNAEPLSEAPAAIYVITRDEIRRSGATSMQEILRLAPNLQVARDSNYAISARGFNDNRANKLLVLVDGRSVYTPLYSGVFWDSVAVLPEDIERIEVISGPGATLWGANAVNGVINIVTRSSRDTQGGVVTATGGNLDNGIGMRYGGKLGENATFRLYAMDYNHGNTLTAAGADANDSWSNPQAGFRVDWSKAADAITFQGDIFSGMASSDVETKGHNLIGRWTRDLAGGSALQIQAYYDNTSRAAPTGMADEVAVFDLDLQHNFLLGDTHSIVWGGGYRRIHDDFTNAGQTFLSPDSKTLELGNVFVEDTIGITDDLKLIAGVKVETNSFTGTAAMPSVRGSWKVTESDLLWASIARAVRTPSRFDRDVFQNVGGVSVFDGGPHFNDEILTAYELGYRTQSFARASLSISAYYNVYDDLRTAELASTGSFPITIGNSSGFLPATFENMMEGEVYGVEIWGVYSVADWWRLTAGYNALHEDFRFKPGSRNVPGLEAAANDPSYQFSLRSSMNLGSDWELDMGLRGVGALPHPSVPSYVTLDARIGWRIFDNLEISLAGFNLLDETHPEFGAVPTRGELRRSFTLNTRWTF